MRIPQVFALAALVAHAAAQSVSTGPLTIGVTAAPGTFASVSTFSFFAAGAQTINLPPALKNGDQRAGGTWTAALGGAIALPFCATDGSCKVSSNATSILVEGLQVRPEGGAVLATETWQLTALNASAVSWTVRRTYGAGVALAFGTMGITLQTTGGLPIHSQQIPSYLDVDMFYNASSTGGFDMGGNSFFEYLSPRTRQDVRFSPTGALFVVEGAATDGSGSALPLFHSFSKPFGDGTAWCNFGFETVDRRAPTGRPVMAGSVEIVTMTLLLVADDVPVPAGIVDPFPTMAMAIPNATLLRQIQTLTSVQLQFNGWIFGNNPASTPCLHESAWWPLITSVFPADSRGMAAGKAMQQELSAFGACGWQPDAWSDAGTQVTHSCALTDGAKYGLSQRWSSAGFYQCPWGPLQDENVMFPIAVAQTAAITGDLVWLRSMLPALQALQAYFASRGLGVNGSGAFEVGVAARVGYDPSPIDVGDGTGPVVFVCPATGIADGAKHASNWYDIVEFGHFDAFIAVHGVWALQSLADIYTALGMGPEAGDAQALHDRAAVDFNAIFWNASGAAYTDWIDVQGVGRSFFYTDISFIAIFAGIASPAQASAMISHYDTRLADIYAEGGIPAGNIWSPPCSLYPITNQKEICNGNGKPLPFPGYENGGSFFHTAGFQLAALGAVGRQDDAYAAFQAVLDSGFGTTRGWAQQLYWGTTDSLVGGDPLNTALVIVWGFVRACFGVATTLRGLRRVGGAATALEGANITLSVLGVSQCVRVTAGRAAFCNGSAIPQ
jgi:hypothetical protein